MEAGHDFRRTTNRRAAGSRNDDRAGRRRSGDRDAIEAIAKPQSLPFNWAFVGNADSLERLKPGEAIEHIAIAAASGIVGVVSKGTDEELWKVIHQFGLPLIKTGSTAGKARRFVPGCRAAGLEHRERFETAVAPRPRQSRLLCRLAVLQRRSNQKAGEAIDWKKLARVMVAGETVWENGKRAGGTPGIFLRRT